MPNYFFSIRTGDSFISNVTGSEQVDLPAARQCAEAAAREYLAKQIEAHELLSDGMFEIRDVHNDLVDAFPVKDVMTLDQTDIASPGLDSQEPMTNAGPGHEFALSSNGDRWFLSTDEATQLPYVLHRANQPSGGAATRYEIADFLELNPGSPQQVALMSLIGTLAGLSPDTSG